MHKALEFFYGVKEPPAPSIQELLKNYEEGWISVGYKDEAQEAEYFQDGKDILREYYKRHAADFQVPLSVEFDFKMEVEGVPVTGKVDRIDRLADGRLSVLDYKTGKALAVARIQEDAQLTMYQLACETLLDAEVGQLIFYHLPTHKAHTVGRRPDAQVQGLKRVIVETAEAVTAGRFEPNPGEKYCRWCDYKKHCPIYSGAQPPSAPTATGAPLPHVEDELASLIDAYGELQARQAEAVREADKVKAAILDILRRKGYVRAFGSRFEIARSGAERWDFPEHNKKKVLNLLKQAGIYERVLAPSAPLIQKLICDPAADPDLRTALRELGSRVDACELKVTPL
jgi:RecB family exonuclease